MAFAPTIVCLLVMFGLTLSRRVSLSTQRLERESQPNPPDWPSSVVVFGPEDNQHAESKFYELSAELLDLHSGHFSSKRLAFLFKPGIYTGNFKVGYYVQVLGLGKSAEDVIFNGYHGVWAPAMDPASQGSLDTFWRSAENFRSEAAHGLRWAVSQAAPLRRIHVTHDLHLHFCGLGECMASGGFMANMIVDGQVDFGSQQQWTTRNVDIHGGSSHGAWNLVFVGCTGAPASTFPGPHDPEKSVSNIARTPIRAEKPFISIDASGRYTLQIPGLHFNSTGAQIDASSPMQSIPFEEVYVARDTDVSSIQQMLDAGYHVVMTPGIYHLQQSLMLKHPGQTLLGLGLATVMAPSDGSPCVKIMPGIPGVRVAGLMLGAAVPQDGTSDSPGSRQGVLWPNSTLLEWGEIGDNGSPEDPGFLFDIFARVGGDYADAQVDTVLKINSGHVIGDHIWLWRADHAKLAPGEAPGWITPELRSSYHLVQSHEAQSNHGLVVHGNDVTMYGLQVEHFLQDQTVWYGDRGRTYMYQCELPYDVTQEAFSDKGYVGYRVVQGVHSHRAYGVGIYTFWRDVEVNHPTAVIVPERCHQAVPDTACYDHITRVQTKLHQGDLSYPNLSTQSSFEEIQLYLYQNKGICGRPCAPSEIQDHDIVFANVLTRFLNGYGGINSIMGFEGADGQVMEIAGPASTVSVFKEDPGKATKRLPYGLDTRPEDIDRVVRSMSE